MKVLFLGGVFPKDQEKEIYALSKGIIQTAADKLQWHFIEGIEEVLKQPVDIISSEFVGCFPDMYKKWYIRKHTFSHREKAKDLAIGFLNIKGLEIYHRILKLYRPVLKWIRHSQGVAPQVIVVYSASPQFLHAIKKVKEAYPKVHTCLIVADLPEYMTGTSHKTFARYVYDHFMKEKLHGIVYNNMQYVDSFVLLTDQMKEPLGVGSRPYVVVEGIAGNYNGNQEVAKLDASYKTILYTGTLLYKYGVMDLVEAFLQIPNAEYRLIICGSGDAQGEIERLTKEDPRIIFRGNVTHKEVIRLQSEATILVNPRRNNEVYTKYSFPSKTMEYLVSGRPVLMHRLDGIPKEYDDYVFYFDTYPDKTMSEVLIEICQKTNEELELWGNRAREFILTHKNATIQSKKVMDMIRYTL